MALVILEDRQAELQDFAETRISIGMPSDSERRSHNSGLICLVGHFEHVDLQEEVRTAQALLAKLLDIYIKKRGSLNFYDGHIGPTVHVLLVPATDGLGSLEANN